MHTSSLKHIQGNETDKKDTFHSAANVVYLRANIWQSVLLVLLSSVNLFLYYQQLNFHSFKTHKIYYYRKNEYQANRVYF